MRTDLEHLRLIGDSDYLLPWIAHTNLRTFVFAHNYRATRDLLTKVKLDHLPPQFPRNHLLHQMLRPAQIRAHNLRIFPSESVSISVHLWLTPLLVSHPSAFTLHPWRELSTIAPNLRTSPPNLDLTHYLHST